MAKLSEKMRKEIASKLQNLTNGSVSILVRDNEIVALGKRERFYFTSRKEKKK